MSGERPELLLQAGYANNRNSANKLHVYFKTKLKRRFQGNVGMGCEYFI